MVVQLFAANRLRLPLTPATYIVIARPPSRLPIVAASPGGFGGNTIRRPSLIAEHRNLDYERVDHAISASRARAARTSLVLSPPSIAARIGSDSDQSSIFGAVCGAAISLVGSERATTSNDWPCQYPLGVIICAS